MTNKPLPGPSPEKPSPGESRPEPSPEPKREKAEGDENTSSALRADFTSGGYRHDVLVLLQTPEGTDVNEVISRIRLLHRGFRNSEPVRVGIPVDEELKLSNTRNEIYAVGGSIRRADIEKLKSNKSVIAVLPDTQLTPEVVVNLKLITEEALTPHYLVAVISPLLEAIERTQVLIDEIQNRASQNVVIRSIRHGSVSISLDGVVDALRLIRNTIIPWWRNYEREMAKHEGKLKRVAVEKARIEVEESRLEVQRRKFQLAMEIVSQLGPNLSEAEKSAQVGKLVPLIDKLIANELVVDIS